MAHSQGDPASVLTRVVTCYLGFFGFRVWADESRQCHGHLAPS